MASGVNLTFNLFGKDQTASKAIKGVGDTAEETHGRFGKLGGSMGKMGLAMAGGVAAAGAAAVVAGKALYDMGEAAAADAKAADRLALGLKNTTGATKDQIAGVEAWITAQGKALGVTDDEMRPAFQRLAQATGDVGDAQKLASVAMDASAGTGKSLQTVSEALAKAQDGNVGALKRLGIETKDAEGKTMSFDQIVANMGDTFKGQAAEGANTLEGKVGRLKLMFDETKESIGAKLLPIAEKLADWVMNTAIPAFGRFAEAVMPKLREAWDKITAAFEDARPGLEKIWDAFKVIGEVIATKVAPILIKMYEVYLTNLFKMIGKVGEFLPKLAGFFLNMADIAVTAFANLFEAATAAFGGILSVAAATIGRLPGFEWVGEANDKFKAFRETATANLDKVRDGLDKAKASVKAWDESASQTKEAKLKAETNEAMEKLRLAKESLKDPDLTKERRAEIKAEIADLKEKVATAKAELAGVKDKTVQVKVVISREGNVYQITPGESGGKKPLFQASGGLIRGFGSGTSDSIAAYLSNGEYVIRAASVAQYGVGLFDALNSGAPTGGGGVLPAGGGGGNIIVQVNGGMDSAETIARRVQTALLDLKRRQGVNLGLA